MKLQVPVLLAVVVPSALVPPSDTVTVAPAGAVPVRVTDSLEFSTPLLMTGAAGPLPELACKYAYPEPLKPTYTAP